MSDLLISTSPGDGSVEAVFDSTVNRFVRDAYEATIRQALGPVVLAKFTSQ